MHFALSAYFVCNDPEQTQSAKFQELLDKPKAISQYYGCIPVLIDRGVLITKNTKSYGLCANFKKRPFMRLQSAILGFQ